MVVEDHPGVDRQPFVLAAVLERAHHDVAAGDGGEDGQPFDDGRGDEITVAGLTGLVAAAHGGSLSKQSFGDKCVPKLELGNE